MSMGNSSEQNHLLDSVWCSKTCKTCPYYPEEGLPLPEKNVNINEICANCRRWKKAVYYYSNHEKILNQKKQYRRTVKFSKVLIDKDMIWIEDEDEIYLMSDILNEEEIIKFKTVKYKNYLNIGRKEDKKTKIKK